MLSVRARAAALAAVALLLGVGTGVLEMRVLIAVIGALAAFGLLLARPVAALPLLLFAVPFGAAVAPATATAPDAGAGIGIAEVLVALTTVAWLADGARRGRVFIRPGGLAAAGVLLATLMALSTGYAGSVSLAIKECLKWVELVLVLIITIDLTRDQVGRALWLASALLAAGAIEALSGVSQSVLNAGPADFAVAGSLRAFGHFEQPNPFGGYLGMILPLAIVASLAGGTPLRFRVLAGASALSIAAGLLASQSRGAMLGVLAAGSVLLLVWNRRTRVLLVPAALTAMLTLALALVGFLPAQYVDRVAQAVAYFGVFDVRTVDLTSQNFAVVERMAHWQAGWAMFADHPWLGVGAGNYAEAYPMYQLPGWPNALGHAHNYYLNTAAELGLVGLLGLAAVLFLVFRTIGQGLAAFPQSVSADRAAWRMLLAGVLGALIVYCVHNLFDDLFVHAINIQLGLLLGLAACARAALRGTRVPETT